MHELHADRETAERQPHARPTRPDSTHAQPTRQDFYWFARQLGDGWQEEEPGIYRYVGAGRSAVDPVATEEPGDALARPPRQRANFNGAEHAATDEAERRWWRR